MEQISILVLHFPSDSRHRVCLLSFRARFVSKVLRESPSQSTAANNRNYTALIGLTQGPRLISHNEPFLDVRVPLDYWISWLPVTPFSLKGWDHHRPAGGSTILTERHNYTNFNCINRSCMHMTVYRVSDEEDRIRERWTEDLGRPIAA